MEAKIQTTSEALELFLKSRLSGRTQILTFFKEQFDESLAIEPQFRAYMNEVALIKNQAITSHEWKMHRAFLIFLIEQKITFLKNDISFQEEIFESLISWNYPRPRQTKGDFSHAASIRPLGKRLHWDIKKITFENIKDYVVRRSPDKRFNPFAIFDFFEAVKSLVETKDKSTLREQDIEILKIAKRIEKSELDQIVSFASEFANKYDWKRSVEKKPELLSKKEREVVLKKLTGEHRVMFCLMAWNGLGFEELFDISKWDISLKEKALRVTNEKNKPTQIPLFDQTIKELTRFLKQKSETDSSTQDNVLFTNQINSRENFNEALRLSLGKEEIDADDLKLTAGRLLYEKGVRLEVIQKILRLTNLKQLEYCYYSDNFEKEHFKIMWHL